MFALFFVFSFLFQLQYSCSIKVEQNLVLGVPGGVAAVLTFGMARGGTWDFDYSVNYINTDGVNTTLVTQQVMIERNQMMQLLVVSESQRVAFYDGFSYKTNETMNSGICNSPVTFRKELYGSGSISHTIGDDSPDSLQYSVLLVSCRNSKGLSANVSISVVLLNPMPYSSEFTHLPINETAHMTVDIGFIIFYSVMLIGLAVQMWLARRYMTMIHYLFLLTVVLQLLDIIFDYAYYVHAHVYGEESTMWRISSNFIDHSSEVAIMLTFLLLSMGWSTLQFRLTERQQMRTLGSVSMYWVMGMGMSACVDEESPLCQSIYLVTYIMHALLLLAIIICLNFTITQLRAMLTHSPWDPSTPYYYGRVRQFQTFRVAFCLFLLLPTGFLLMNDLMFSWKESWILYLLNNLLYGFVILNLGSAFAPFQDAFLTRAFDGTFSNGPQGNREHQD